MMRNLPASLSRDCLVQLLEAEGFRATFDFVYMPLHFGDRTNFGYAFVNLISQEHAARLWGHFANFAVLPETGEERLAGMSWSTMQGYGANVQHFRDSRLMHPEVEDCFKPVVFQGGVRVAFPSPTKPLFKPRGGPSRRGRADSPPEAGR